MAVEGGGTIVNGVHDQEPGGDDAARPVRSADRVLAAAQAAGSSQAQIGGSGVGAGHGRVGGGRGVEGGQEGVEGLCGDDDRPGQIGAGGPDLAGRLRPAVTCVRR